MSAAAEKNADGNHEETLKLMKLTSKEEVALFEKIMGWWKSRPLRLSIKIDPAVGAALIARILLANSQVPLQSKSNLASPFKSSAPPFVSPDETTVPSEEGEDKVVVESNKSSARTRAAAKKVTEAETNDDNDDDDKEPPHLRSEFLVSLASDLAVTLAHLSVNERTSTAPTVAYVASAYYFLFKGKVEYQPTQVATEMVWQVIREKTPQAEVLKYSKLLQKVLLALGSSAKASLEAISDFDHIWAACSTYPSFQDAMVIIGADNGTGKNTNGKRVIEVDSITKEELLKKAKKICWKLACLAEEERKGLALGLISGRFGRLIRAGACIALVASVPGLFKENKENNDTDAIDTSVNDDKDDSSQASRASKKSRCSQDDAVDVLRSMVKERESPSSQEEGQSSSAYDMPPIEVVKKAVDDLLISLQPSFKTTKEVLSELQYAALNNIKLFRRAGLLPSSEEEESDTMVVGDDMALPKLVDPKYQEKLKARLASEKECTGLADPHAIDKALSKSLENIVCNFDKKPMQRVSFEGFPFVHNVSLGSSEVKVLHYLCMASSKASSEGVALISQYDGGKILPRNEDKAVEAFSVLSGSPPSREMREMVELNEWTAAILSITDVRPKTKLMLYLEASDDESVKRKRRRPDGVIEEIVVGGGWRTIVVPVLNRVIERFVDDGSQRKRSISISEEDGSLVVPEGAQDNAEIKLCKALIALYYQSLEAMLYYETARLMSASHPKLIMSELFHRAALTCCCICLVKGLCSSSALPISEKFIDLDLPTIQQIMESCPYTFLKVSESFARALKLYKLSGQGQQSYHVLGLPRILQGQLSQCEVLVIDSLLWSREPNHSLDLSIMDIVENLKSTSNEDNVSMWPPEVLAPTLPEEIADNDGPQPDRPRGMIPDHMFLAYIIRKLLKVAFFRISALCSQLSIPPEYPVASQVWIAFRYLLRHNIELLYDRHVDQLILCTMYGVCKIMKVQPEPTFSKIIDVYAVVRGSEIGERACHRLVRHIKLTADGKAPSNDPKKEYGNIIQLYNSLFVPALKNHLLQSESLKQAIAKLQLYMADPSKIGEEDLAEQEKDTETMTARAGQLTNESGNWANAWANAPKFVPVKEGNVKMNVLLPTAQSTDPVDNKKKKGKGKTDDSSSENKTFFSFGSASAKNVNMLNQMAET